jgi:hypothetical protein
VGGRDPRLPRAGQGAALAADTADAYGKLLKFLEGPAGRVWRKMMKKPAREALESFILPLGRVLVDGRNRGADCVLYDAPAALLCHSSPYSDGAAAYIACTYAMLRGGVPGARDLHDRLPAAGARPEEGPEGQVRKSRRGTPEDRHPPGTPRGLVP